MAAGPFRSGFETGCLIMFGLFALLIMIGKCSQGMGQ